MSGLLSPLSVAGAPTPGGSARRALRPAKSPSREHKTKRTNSLKPQEYGKAVRAYSRLPTGAGQNYFALGDFLTVEPTSTEIYVPLKEEDCVTLYTLEPADATSPTPVPSSPLSHQGQVDSETDLDSADESRRHHLVQKPISFTQPSDFFSHTKGWLSSSQQSSIVFLQGYMSAAWINNLGARYILDPEYFCRHLDFRPVNDKSNNFSTPSLPSSSWHLIELPVFTIGSRIAPKAPPKLDKIEELRKEGAEELVRHHHLISKLSSSEIAVGESMVRDFFLFDEIHFAIEQRISICMQPTENKKSFTIVTWLDAGTDQLNRAPSSWAVQEPESCYLPVILHRHMIALKSHLFNDATVQSLSIPTEYGRSLRRDTMSRDAFYCMTEVFNFAASSQMQFLNLVDVKLDAYTSLSPEQDFRGLPNLKYMKEILDHYIQKTERVVYSIRNAQKEKWPKDRSEAGRQKATSAAENIEQDFVHLQDRAQILHRRTTEAISVLMSSISISESQRAIEQAQRMGKLTFLAFIFVPLSFTTAFFAMNFSYIKWWIAASVPVTGLAVASFFFDLTVPLANFWKKCKKMLVPNAFN